MNESQHEEFSYWRHTWKDVCFRLPIGKSWGVSVFEEITEMEYEDWVWERRKMWLWDKDVAYLELGLELL